LGASRTRICIVVAAASWLVIVGYGLAELSSYANTPGPGAVAPRIWPAYSRVVHDGQRPTLVMLVHPQCACSRASIGELALLMARSQGRLTAHVLVYYPRNSGEVWARTDLWHQAAQIPGVAVSGDADGDEAARFGAFVSGQTLVFDTRRKLAFDGGITFARGHSGDNAGRDAIQALVNGRTPAARRTPVFGCLLGHPTAI
jgi:hypothetical protein